MADQAHAQSTPGPTLPTPESREGTTATTSPPARPPGGVIDTSAQKLVIGAGILIVLIVAFVFVKNGYANMLVGRKIAPRSANTAGWLLFVLLTSLATLGVLGGVSQGELLTLFVVIPLGLVALLALVFLVASSRR